jgi:DNA-binding protein H-NS
VLHIPLFDLHLNLYRKLKSDIESKFSEIINAQNEKINEQKDEIMEANNKIALLSEIQNQSGILSNKMNKYIMKLGT